MRCRQFIVALCGEINKAKCLYDLLKGAGAAGPEVPQLPVHLGRPHRHGWQAAQDQRGQRRVLTGKLKQDLRVSQNLYYGTPCRIWTRRRSTRHCRAARRPARHTGTRPPGGTAAATSQSPQTVLRFQMRFDLWITAVSSSCK